MGKDELIYVRGAKLMKQRFDQAKGSMTGEPELIAADVSYFHPTSRADFDASQSGTIIYRTDTSKARLVLLDRKGNETALVDDKELFFGHAISPDGRKAAVSVMTRDTGLCDIWIYDLARGLRERFTDSPGVAFSPVWMPDGRSLVYSATQGGVFPHVVLRTFTASTSEDLMPRGLFVEGKSISPDNDTLFYQQFTSATQEDIYRLSMKRRKSTVFLKTNFSEGEPKVSPDGVWLAFTSDATGTSEVYLQNLNDGSARIRLSAAGGTNPRWRHDGKELFFVSRGNVLSATTRSGRWDDATFAELFRLPANARELSVSPDGQSFMVSSSTPGPGDSFFHVVLGD